MKKNYNTNAANWWAEKIQGSEAGPVHGLDLFVEDLSSQIKTLSNINGSVVISTYGSSSKLLDEIAFRSGLSAKIPSGYEMKIILGNVWVYNPSGMLIASF